jgi:hypothetical protein
VPKIGSLYVRVNIYGTQNRLYPDKWPSNWRLAGLSNGNDSMSKESKTFPIGRDAKSGEFIPVKEAKSRPSTTTLERMPKPGRGDTKRK